MGLDERVWGGADEASGAVGDKAAERTMEPEAVRAALYVFAFPHFPGHDRELSSGQTHKNCNGGKMLR